MYFRIETTDPDIAQARKQNAEHVGKVMEAIRDLKIKGLKMKSDNVELRQIHAEQKQMKTLPKLLGYRIIHDFTVLIENENAEKLSAAATQVLDTALTNGANSVQQISFFKKDLTDARQRALTQATEDALDNARALAKGAGKKITDIITVDGNPAQSQYYQMTNSMNVALPAGAGSPALVIGDLEVTCRVNVTCAHD